MVSIKVLKADGETKFVERGDREAYLVATSEYGEGDRIVLEYAGEPKYFWFQADDALGEALILVTGNVEFKIPFGEAKTSYSPKSFSGTSHYLHVREAAEYEIYAYRNLALNVYDNHENNTSYPHASANVETRNEAVFAARNAIDGVKANSSHGQWPYTSWGINRNPDALIRIDFGNKVEVDKAVIYLRADFPHDNWWNEVTLEFSDGTSIKAQLKKTHEAQEICFDKRTVTWVEMKNLIKAENESPFPALTQLEVYGKVCK